MHTNKISNDQHWSWILLEVEDNKIPDFRKTYTWVYYTSSVWDPHTKKYIGKIKSTQRRAVQLIRPKALPQRFYTSGISD